MKVSYCAKKVPSCSGNYSGTPLVRPLKDKLDYIHVGINAELTKIQSERCFGKRVAKPKRLFKTKVDWVQLLITLLGEWRQRRPPLFKIILKERRELTSTCADQTSLISSTTEWVDKPGPQLLTSHRAAHPLWLSRKALLFSTRPFISWNGILLQLVSFYIEFLELYQRNWAIPVKCPGFLYKAAKIGVSAGSGIKK